MSAPSMPADKRMVSWFRPRSLGWVGFYGLILLAWVAVAVMATDVPGAGQGSIPAEFWAALCAGAGQAGPFALWSMWALMATAMMLPTFVPALRGFADLGAAGATDRAGIAALVAGYLVVWLGASVAGAGAQWALARAGLLTPFGASLSPWLTFLLLIGAGAYQFTALKDACLTKCRMPLTYFIERWRPGAPAAFSMGLHLGALCLGCCWALMALGFVGGVMNLIWMGAATLFMTLEKLPDIGRPLTRPAGVALIAAGGFVALRALHFN